MTKLRGALIVALAAVIVPAQAFAHGGARFGITLGLPLYFGPPPVVYTPPAVVYLPPSVGYTSEPIVAEPASPIASDQYGRYCREYRSEAVVGTVRQPIHGTACLEPDGTWRVVR